MSQTQSIFFFKMRADLDHLQNKIIITSFSEGAKID